ncbi:synaptogyrin 2, isoform CRA_a [Rattus norvegicus]|uniref:Synaptogyrin 2, isoform CRA_a n=1 Tax=Rattus norvegicus TaxID=10116 RepID=A6HL29_RAT|nr:synaptogyrin 2, isoform CRA_a [Rattus norvegicus]
MTCWWEQTQPGLPSPSVSSPSSPGVCWPPWPTSVTRLEWMPSFRTMWTPRRIPPQPTPPTLVPRWKTTSSRPSPRMWRLLRATSLPQCTEQPGTKRQEGAWWGCPSTLDFSQGLLSRTVVPWLLQLTARVHAFLHPSSQSTPEVPMPRGASPPPA